MLAAPGHWIWLFATSALFWWIFEWLNRFVRNWHYLGVDGFGPLAYGAHASLCFSTVLPAVSSVAEWLGTHEMLVRRMRRGPAWRWLERKSVAILCCVGGGFGLALTGVFPTWLYAALWLAPLTMVLGSHVLLNRDGLANELARGNWIRAGTWMLAALMCGFFWELWNWQSMAKWVYTVPGVERWHVFEMPLLGYAGYLPFGLECLLIAQNVTGRIRSPILR